MAQRIESNPLEAAYAALLSQGLDGAGEALRMLLNEAAKIERAECLGAQSHERSPDRREHAHGFKPKTMLTRMGEITFAVPPTRRAGFCPDAPEKGSRSEQALNLALAEMYFGASRPSVSPDGFMSSPASDGLSCCRIKPL